VANLITLSLERLLKENLAPLQAAYRASSYREETTFNEFFIEWYHFFYTAVTNKLAQDGFLTIPRDGNMTYFVLHP